MPRAGRLDAPGVVQHSMIRGIERGSIFRDDTDRQEFLARLARLVPETQTACYAWALLPNYAHRLLRTGAAPLPTLMRRLLTGYAVRFNRRHKSDERILGDSDFVEGILAQANERYTRQYALQRRGIGFEHVVERVAELCHLDPGEVVAAGRQRRKVTARSLLCYWAVREVCLPLTTLARQLGLSPPGVSYAVQRGEAMVREKHFELLK